MVEEVNSVGNVKKYTYDANGNIIQITDEAGNITTNQYDGTGNLTKTDYTDTTVLYVYNKKGELVQFENEQGKTVRKLDPLGRLQEIEDANGMVTKHRYDKVGNQTETTLPNGSKITKEYDKNNRLTKVKDSDGKVTNIAYDKNGNEIKKVNAIGDETNYIYNNMDEKIKTTELRNGKIVRTSQIKRDEIGNIVEEKIEDTRNAMFNSSKAYKYDKGNRLIESINNGIKTEYKYDEAGNLVIEKNNVIGQVAYTYNNENQLLTKKQGNDQYTYEYDKIGNLKTEAKNGTVIKQYEYNGMGKMVLGENVETNESSRYLYDGLGMRVATEKNFKNKDMGYQNNKNNVSENILPYLMALEKENEKTGTGNVYAQMTYETILGLTRQTEDLALRTDYIVDYTSDYNNDIMTIEHGSYITEYVYGNGKELLSQKTVEDESILPKGKNPRTSIATRNIGKVYFHSEVLGSASYVTDPKGEILSYTEYDPWGKIESEKDNTGMNFAGLDRTEVYTVHDYDGIIDKYYAQNRFYDGDSKRFIQIDPIKDGWNWYAYCNNDPVNGVDGLGLSVDDDPQSHGVYTEIIKYAEIDKHLNSLYSCQSNYALAKQYRKNYKPFADSRLDLASYLKKQAEGGARERDNLKKCIVYDFGYSGKGTARYNEAVSLMSRLKDVVNGIQPMSYTLSLINDFKAHWYGALNSHLDASENEFATGVMIMVPTTAGAAAISQAQYADEATDALQSAVCGSGSTVSNNVATIASNGGNMTAKYTQWAIQGTHEPNSKITALGKYLEGISTSYDAIARQMKYTYFQLENWGQIQAQIGASNMWNINREFLTQQASQGKIFLLTHNPYEATGYFFLEVSYLKDKGYQIIKEGIYWIMTK